MREIQRTKLFEGVVAQRPVKPKRPPCRLIKNENFLDVCNQCGSSNKRLLFGLGPVVGCIQPKCDNFYKQGTESFGPQ